jgi:GNAT superfamily N-acetyltransferase
VSGVTLRDAAADDAPAISVLLGELGHPADPAEVVRRMARLGQGAPQDRALVAERSGRVCGLVVIHFVPVLHRATEVGRVTALVVLDSERRRGIGKALLEAAERIIRAQGSRRAELTSGQDRTGAHRFYESPGYCNEGIRFAKPL